MRDIFIPSWVNLPILAVNQEENMRVVSWNVNGIRAVVKKGFWDWFNLDTPDVLCLQETKAQPDQLDGSLINPLGYHAYYHSAERKGYSGVTTWCKTEPLSVQTDILNESFNREGRIVLTEHPDFFLYNVYFPNGQKDQDRLDYKLRFYGALQEHIRETDKIKPVIITGDFNTAHTEIDLARPKANEKTSGFMPEERVWVDRYLDSGFVDTFRKEHPGAKGYYSWWSYRANARVNNVGWRIDYFLVSEKIAEKVDASRIHPNVMGSDHCPVSIVLQ